MSIAAMNWVWEFSQAKPATRLVLLALADRAGADGGDCWPSIADTARRTGLSARQVQRQLRKLEDLGEITVEFAAGRHRTNRYRLTMNTEKVSLVSGVTSTSGVTLGAEKVTPKVKKGDAGDTRTISNPPIEPRLDPDDVERLGEEAAKRKAELRSSEEGDDPWVDGPRLSISELRKQREEAKRVVAAAHVSKRRGTVSP